MDVCVQGVCVCRVNMCACDWSIGTLQCRYVIGRVLVFARFLECVCFVCVCVCVCVCVSCVYATRSRLIHEQYVLQCRYVIGRVLVFARFLECVCFVCVCVCV